MKKSIIALMGLFTLVACSEDSYQEADKMNESRTVENNSGGMQTNSIDPAIPYESPYNLSAGPCCSQVEYLFDNKTDLDLNAMAIVALARFDGASDLNHFGWKLSNLSTPNVLHVEGGEYLAFVATRPKNIPALSIVTSGFYSQQLPVYPNGSNFFELVPHLTTVPITGYETALYHEYGKVYQYHVEVKDSANNVIYDGWVRVPFLPDGITDPNQVSNDWNRLATTEPSLQDFWVNKLTKEICAGNDISNYPGQMNDLNGQKSSYTFFSANGLKEYKITSFINQTQVGLKLEEI